MDRRLFLTGLLGIAGAATIGRIVQPESASAGVPGGSMGILDELKEPVVDAADDAAVEPELVDHRPGHYGRHRRYYGPRHHYRPHRRRRRRAYRRVCERYRRHGRWHRRCYRRRVWVYT